MKKLVLPGVIVLIVILLIGGVMGVSKAIFTNRFEAEIAAIKAKGEPLTWEQLLGKPIPASQNAADIYEKIHQKTATGSYKSDYEVVDRVVGLRGAPIDAATKQKLAKALAHTRPLLDLTAEAVSRPKYELYSDPATGMADFRQFAELRSMCRLLRGSSVLHAESGDMAAAVYDVSTQFRMADQLESGSTLIAQLVRVAVIDIATESLKDAARYGDLSERQARQLHDALGSIDVAQGFRRSWLGERVFSLYCSDPSRIGGIAGIMVAPGGIPPGPGRIAAAPLDAFYYRVAVRGDEAAYLGFIAKQLDGIPLGFREAKSRGLFDAPSLPVYAVLSKTLSPVFARASFTRFRAEENLARTQVFLALQAYKARYGGYPATMQELKSKLGWKLPKDPFSEKDFIYKRQAKGFILYSVGPDMKDDGGRSLGDHVEIDSKGDIVLRWDRYAGRDPHPNPLP